MRTGHWIRVLATLLVLCIVTPACQSPVVPTATAPTAPTPTATIVVSTPLPPAAKPTPLPTLTPTVPPRPTRSYAQPHPLVDNLRIRTGIAYCTNRAELIRSVYPWLEDTAFLEMDSFLPRTHWAYPKDDINLRQHPFDPQKGQTMFERAGWKLEPGATYRTNAAGEEMVLELLSSSVNSRKTWTAVFEEQMNRCGLRVVLSYIPSGVHHILVTSRQPFEMMAWGLNSEVYPDVRTYYQCDQAPSQENDWRGENRTGWCNPIAEAAIHAATGTLEREKRREAYYTIQEEFSKDVPGIPLFNRIYVSAANPALENFAPDAIEVYTWNIAQWKLPGQDTIVIGEASEPSSLLRLFDDSYFAQLLGAMVSGLDYTSLNYDFQPVTLKQFPTIENGGAVNTIVQVEAGDSVVDLDGDVVQLVSSIKVRDAQGREVEFAGDALQVNQLVVRYEFIDGLTWSDGTPVSKADYELDYQIRCDPAAYPGEYDEPPAVCDKIAQVDFVSDTTYVVTWKPGYADPQYFLPPIRRLPAHQISSDGRKLADVPIPEWDLLPEFNEKSLGIGPYVVERWERGKEIVFKANPYFYQGLPVTPNIIIRFLVQDEMANALVSGQVDMEDAISATGDEMGLLLLAQTKGDIRLYLVPSVTYECIDFALADQ